MQAETLPFLFALPRTIPDRQVHPLIVKGCHQPIVLVERCGESRSEVRRLIPPLAKVGLGIGHTQHHCAEVLMAQPFQKRLPKARNALSQQPQHPGV